MTPQLFRKNRAELLACSREEHDDVFIKLVAGALETEKMAPPGRDGLHAGAGSAPPTPVRKLGGRVLLCTLTDLPREIELPSVVTDKCEPETNGETVFIVMHSSSNATHPVDIDDKNPAKRAMPLGWGNSRRSTRRERRHAPCTPHVPPFGKMHA